MTNKTEQQAVPVAQDDLFDVQPQVSTIDNGPEPSIREMVRSFYNHHAVINPDAVTEQYLAALSHPCKSGESAGISDSMKPWAGGDAAPVDWDGGPVTLRNGSTMFPSNVSLAYHANGTDRWNHQRENRNRAWDIIAYSAALTPDATQTREVEGLDRLFSIEPNVGATTNEPSLHTILLGYYLPHFEYDEAKRLADAYVAALNARGGA